MPGLASGTKWLGTIMPALTKEQPSRFGPSALDERDTMPLARTVIRDAQADDAAADDEDMLAHASLGAMPQHNGIGVVEDQRRLGGDVGRAGDVRQDPVATMFVDGERGLEHAADDALLPPDLARLRACRRRPGTRAWRSCRCRTASGRRPCRGRARSCGCAASGVGRGPNSFDVIDLRAVRAGTPCGIQRLADLRQVNVGQPLDVLASAKRLAVRVDQEEPVAAPGDVARDLAVARARRPSPPRRKR